MGKNDSAKRNRYKVTKNHPLSNVIGDFEENMVTLRQSKLNEISCICYTFQIEPKSVEEALNDEVWLEALHEELNQFTRKEVLFLVPRLKDVNFIGIKWI